MRFPLVILDFEASSLNMESYPIEVGVAVALTSEGPVHVWSSLIRPERDWIAAGDWDPAAERAHRLPASSLAQGRTALEVAESLNRVIGPAGHAYCDGGYYDAMWMERLFKAAGIGPTFQLREMSWLFVLDRLRFRRFANLLNEDEPPHRAGEDAARLCSALIRADGTGREIAVHPVNAEELAVLLAQDQSV